MMAPPNRSLQALLTGTEWSAANGAWRALDSELEVAGMSVDSRAITPGDLFVALAGTRVHGMAHVAQARARGAAAVVFEPAPGVVPPSDLPAVAVPGLNKLLGVMASQFYGHPSHELRVVGVTGTDGKTSTAHLIAQGLGQLGQRCGYLGTIGYGLIETLDEATHTTPDAIRVQHHLAQLRDRGAQACAMEVSSHALDQHRVAGVSFAATVLTNVGRDHLDYHGTDENYAAAKYRLFTDCAPQHAVLNGDDALGLRWAKELLSGQAGLQSVSAYGFDAHPELVGAHHLQACRVQAHPAGLRIELATNNEQAVLESRLLGRFNAANLMAALAVLCRLGTPLADAINALAAARTVPGRMEAFYQLNQADAPAIVVDYAHTAQALRAALSAARAHVRGRLICVFGCGGDRDRGKRPLMGAAVAELADLAIVTDDNPRSENPADIVSEIFAGISNEQRSKFTVQHERAAAIAAAIASAKSGDVVVIAGKGHEREQESGGIKRPFSDRDTVAKLLGLNPPTASGVGA